MTTTTSKMIDITDMTDAELDALLRSATEERAARKAAAAPAPAPAPTYKRRFFNDETCRWETREAPLTVGMGASFGYGCDSYAYTVVYVSKTGHKVGIVSAHQDRETGEWSHDPNATPQFFTRRSPGRDGETRYCPVGSPARRSPSLALDCRIERRDPHF